MTRTKNGIPFACAASVLLLGSETQAQPKGFLYDEAGVPKYDLPDPLVTEAGKPVETAQQWWDVRRPEVLALFEEQMYGRTPTEKLHTEVEIFDQTKDALGGKATRRQYRLHFRGSGKSASFELLVYIPNDVPKPVPAFLGLNFRGNHTITPETAIPVHPDVAQHERGSRANRWPVEAILERGYALATAYYGDIDPDVDDFGNGIHPLFYDEGQTRPAADQWGAIGAWAWGLSRALDVLVGDPAVAGDAVAVLGHSRLGKTSLWAGAQDQRFAMVISNDSGCGGAALSRRAFGETVARINKSFPHWFCTNFHAYGGNEAELPIDQHELIALIAPRPVYVASATEDLWADPRGEFLSAYHASPVYELLGRKGLDRSDPPAADEPVHGTISYHERTGKHDLTEYDWQRYMDVADRFLKPKTDS